MRLVSRSSLFSYVDLVVGRLQQAAVGAAGLRLARLLVVTAQLGLILLVIYAFRIEVNYGLLRLVPLIFFGFVVHAVLPLRYRMPFFLALSLAAIGMIVGFPHSIGLVAIGLGLIGLCHLPVPFAGRVALLAGAGALLAALRAGWIETFWATLPTVVLPILGAMFMFRLIIYLYDLRHERVPASIWERLSYFFMLPNVCFLLFPVVDYQTFRRTYYNAESAEIYQKGVLWMYRGVVHLLLYRLIYYHLIPAPSEVEALGGVVQSMLTTYGLYLRISGQFHLIVGMMCLFGFNLPETHHLYFLASSFNDYWRRINIYWKDFMMKIFYFPSFMALRRWGMTAALVGATLFVFFGTWALHAYQWFWLRGTFPLTAPDALFWGILGVLVVVNALYEARRSRKRSLAKKEAWSFWSALLLAARTVGMFVFICVLWSLWSSPSVGAWVALLAEAGNSGVAAFGVLALVLAGLVLGGVLVQYLASRGWRFTLVGSRPSFARSAWATSAGALLLLALGQPEVQARLGPQAATLVASLQTERLNRQDETLMERGYYEGLLNAESYTSALWQVQGQRPDAWRGIHDVEGLTQATEGLLQFELAPSYRGHFKAAPFQTNSWGMRDQEYALERPPGTYRMALLGASYEMGSGVANHQAFEALVEERLNEEHAGAPYDRYEVLNFSVAAYSVVHNAIVAEEKIPLFKPDVVVLAVHATEDQRLLIHLADVFKSGRDIPFPGLHEILASAGLGPEMQRAELQERLAPAMEDLLRWSFERIAGVCRAQGATPVLLYVPATQEAAGVDREKLDQITALGRRAGLAVVSLGDAFAGHDEEVVRLALWDAHPSILGHQLLADRFYRALLEHRPLFRLDRRPEAAFRPETGLETAR